MHEGSLRNPRCKLICDREKLADTLPVLSLSIGSTTSPAPAVPDRCRNGAVEFVSAMDEGSDYWAEGLTPVANPNSAVDPSAVAIRCLGTSKSAGRIRA